MSSPLSITKMNAPDEITIAYNNLVSGRVYDYGFKKSQIEDQLLPVNQAILNHQALAKYENQFQGYLYFYPPDRNISLTSNQYDDYMTLAVASGALNFLKANNFTSRLYAMNVDNFIQLAKSLPYPINLSNIKSPGLRDTPVQPPAQPETPTEAPTQSPTEAPTQPPVQPSDCPKCEQKKISTEKEIYISLLGALIFLLLSLPLTYKITDVLFGLIGLNTQTEYGCPTYAGLIIHFVVYFLLVFAIMKLN